MPRSLPPLLIPMLLLVMPPSPLARGVMAQTRDGGPGAADAADEPVRLAIGQGVGSPPHLTLFVDLVDAAGTPPASIQSSRVTATIGASRTEVVHVLPFAATGEGVAFIFVVDVSRSVSAGDMARVRAALTRWAADADPRDRFALIAFGDGVTTRADFTADRAAFRTAVAQLRVRDRTTRLHGALERAIELGRRADADLPARRAAIVLSDGKDEGSGLTQDDVAGLLRQDRLPIYAIGCSRLTGRDRTAGFDALRRLAANSGGAFHDASRTPLDDAYAAMRRAIARVFAITLTCDSCPADGQLHRLDLRIAAGSRVLSAGTDLRLPAAVIGGARDRGRSDAARTAARGGSGSGTSDRRPADHAHGGAHGLMHVALELLVAGLLLLLLLLCLGVWWFLRWRRRGRPGTTGDGTAALDGERPPGPEGDAARLSPSPASSSAPMGSNGVAITCHFRGHAAPPPILIPLHDRALIGSAPSCDLVVTGDDEVAPAHGELAWRDGRVMLRRLADQTTLVNGGAIGMGDTAAYLLDNGDLLRLGRTEMRVIIEPLETWRAAPGADPITAACEDATAEPSEPRIDTRTRQVTR